MIMKTIGKTLVKAVMVVAGISFFCRYIPCRERCRRTLQEAVDSATATFKITHNSMLAFPPQAVPEGRP